MACSTTPSYVRPLLNMSSETNLSYMDDIKDNTQHVKLLITAEKCKFQLTKMPLLVKRLSWMTQKLMQLHNVRHGKTSRTSRGY